MDWHRRTAHCLAVLDQQLSPHDLRPAAYEVARRVIYETGDREILAQLQLGPGALQAGAVALAARCPLVVDSPAIQVALLPRLQGSFANPLYCGLGTTVVRPQRQLPPEAWAMDALAQRHPRGMFVIGQGAIALESLVALIKRQAIAPALVIATPPAWDQTTTAAKTTLRESGVPYITMANGRGGVTLAIAIAEALIELTDYSYGQRSL